MSLAKSGLSFFGIPSFAKVPVAELESDWSADVGVLGVPFDQAVGFRSGTRFGPKAIRDMSVRYSFFSDGRGYYDMRSGERRGACLALDFGDVEVVPLDFETSFANVTASVKKILEGNALPLVLGGDHAISFPVLRAFEGRGPITLVHFDAHPDYRDQVGGVRFGHGSVIRRATELAWVERCVSVGIRSIRTREEDLKAMIEDGNDVIFAWDVLADPSAALARLPVDRDVYITFDIDSMDPGIAPGTGTPEVGGLRYEEARALLEFICARNKLVGFDLVEVNPQFDHSQITALLASQIIADVLGFAFRA